MRTNIFTITTKYILLIFMLIIHSCSPKHCSDLAEQPNINKSTKKKILLVEDLKAKNIIPYEKWSLDKPGIKNWNLKAGKVLGFDSKFKIGIFDKNQNGSFTDIGVDILFVTQLNSDFTQYTPAISSSVTILKRKNIVQVDSSFFVVSLGTHDKELFISIKSNISNNSDIVYISMLPTLEINQIDGKVINLDELYPDNLKRLEFWAPWCVPCIDRIINLSNNKGRDKYKTVLVLGDGDITNAKSILNGIDAPFPCLISTPKINSLFNQNGYPYEVLIDSLGNIKYDY